MTTVAAWIDILCRYLGQVEQELAELVGYHRRPSSGQVNLIRTLVPSETKMSPKQSVNKRTKLVRGCGLCVCLYVCMMEIH